MTLFAALTTLALWDFQVDNGGFTESGTTMQWAWGVPQSGPTGTTTLWGTALGGSYLNDAEDSLIVPLVDLGAATAPVLVIRHWYDIQSGDVGVIEVDDGSGFAQVTPIHGYPDPAGFTGSASGWVDTSIDLSGAGPTPRVRLTFRSDVSLASDGWYVEQVVLYDGDATPPRIDALVTPEDTQDLDGPYIVYVEVVDDTAVADVRLRYRVNGGGESTIILSSSGADTWRGEIPGQDPDSTVTWYAEADDGEQIATWPAAGEASFRVFLAAPTDLSGPDDRIVGTHVALSWTAPTSPHALSGYEVTEQGFENWPIPAIATNASVPVTAFGSHIWRVKAVYEFGLGNPSEPLALDVEVPTLDLLDPDAGYQGDRGYLRISGASLYLVDGVSSLALGQDVDVEVFTVLDASSAIATIDISEDAPIGLRDVVLTSPHGDHVFPSAFEVLGGAARPSILEVSPARIRQGETTEVTIRASEPYAGAVAIEAGRGLLLASDVVVDRDVLSFDLLALGTASPGDRTLVLDDGDRLWEAHIEIDEYIEPIERNCASGAGSAGWLGILLAFLGLRRRERR